MTSDTALRAKKKIVGKYADWVKRFDVNDFMQNRAMIEKLYEEKQLALASSLDLEQKVGNLQSDVHRLQLENQRLGIELEEFQKKSSLLFALSLLATILIGIGINLATTSSDSLAGWILIIAACLIEVIAFFSRPTRKKS